MNLYLLHKKLHNLQFSNDTDIRFELFQKCTLISCINYVQYERRFSVRMRHIFSANEDVKYKQLKVDHQFQMSESLFLLIYQTEMISSLWQATKSIN